MKQTLRNKLVANGIVFKIYIVLFVALQGANIVLEYIKEGYYAQPYYDYTLTMGISKIQAQLSYIFVFAVICDLVYIYYHVKKSKDDKLIIFHLIYFTFHYAITIALAKLLGIAVGNSLNGCEMLVDVVIILFVAFLLQQWKKKRKAYEV